MIAHSADKPRLPRAGKDHELLEDSKQTTYTYVSTTNFVPADDVLILLPTNLKHFKCRLWLTDMIEWYKILNKYTMIAKSIKS